MENFKCKRKKIARGKRDLLMNERGKRKSGRKGHLKMLKMGVSRSQEGRGRPKVKDKKGVQGFGSGQTVGEYLEESELAKMREDLNEIINGGREREGFRGYEAKRERRLRKQNPEAVGRKKVGLEEEFEKFSLKYEEAVGRQVLQRLPDRGILEEALEALTKIISSKPEDPQTPTASSEFCHEDTQFLEEYNFFTRNLEGEISGDENLNQNYIPITQYFSPRVTNSPISVSNPLNNWLFMEDLEGKEVQKEIHNRPTIVTSVDIDEEDDNLNVFFFQEKNLEKPTEHLSITTPPIQFYRRNMF